MLYAIVCLFQYVRERQCFSVCVPMCDFLLFNCKFRLPLLSKIASAREKQNKWKRKGREGWGGERKKVHNLLAAFLIELPQHFSRGRSARRLDGLIRMHVRTHAHKQTKGRQSYAEKGSASDELSSVVFLRQIRLSCAQAKQKRWWPPLKSFKKASPRAVLLVHKDASQ